MTLTELAVGQSAVIEDIAGERVQRMKLLDVGLVPQTVVTVRKIAPMGDPIEVGVRSYVLTLRNAEAALIMVKQETIG